MRALPGADVALDCRRVVRDTSTGDCRPPQEVISDSECYKYPRMTYDYHDSMILRNVAEYSYKKQYTFIVEVTVFRQA